jgi:DNA/RNA-binding domain of Phe-tRNA-synthetase-like protein
MLRYDISDIIAEYADVHIGVVVGRGLNNRSSHPQLAQLQQDALKVAKLKIGDQPLTQHPYIASWRQIYKRFGTKPGDYRPSAENLLRRALKTGQLYRINTAVDIYNVVSVKYLLPMGGFDVDHVDGTIRLRKSDGGESFHPLGTKGSEETYPGEIVYADDSRVLTRRWNYRDAVETQITEETVNVVMFFDASAEIPIDIVADAMEEFMTWLREACGGKIVHAIASKDQPVIEL